MRMLERYIPKKYRDLLLYFIVGGSATIVEWAAFWLFESLFGIHYLIATALAFFFSTFANWMFGRLLLFKKNKAMSLLKEISSVYLASVVGLALNLGIMYVLVNLLNVQEMLSKITATTLVFAYNFIVRKYVIYNNKQKDR